MKARIRKAQLIIINDDHGGYKAGFCCVCKSHDWLKDIKHKAWCPIKPGRLEYIEIKEVETKI